MTFRQFSLRKKVIKVCLVIFFCMLTVVVLNLLLESNSPDTGCEIRHHRRLVSQFYEERKDWNTSKLGAILFKNHQLPKKQDKIFKVLIFKHWELLKRRHLYYFGTTKKNPFDGCSVDNCIITGNDSEINTVDAVVIHLHRGIFPKIEKRNTRQRWIFLDDESPHNSFHYASVQPRLKDLAGMFNWSMSYRTDADIPVPYGRAVTLKTPKILKYNNPLAELIPNWVDKKKDVLASILISDCSVSFRNKLLNTIRKYINVHVYGKCGDGIFKESCPGHFRSDCNILSQYLFYLVIENSKCYEYMTEKLFYNAYSKGAIPIIQGPSLEDCRRLLPPNSYLHFDSYDSVEMLVKDMIDIGNDEMKLLYYHRWRLNYDVLNEHGYFGTKSYHLCRVCEGLNYNDQKVSIYNETDLKRFLDPLTLCHDKK